MQQNSRNSRPDDRRGGPPPVKLGDRLRAERERQGVVIDEVSHSTRIASRHLSAIERGDWGALPDGVFARGYLRSYAEWLGLDVESCLRAHAREVRIAGANTAAADPSAESHATEQLLQRIARTRGVELTAVNPRWVLLGLAAVGAVALASAVPAWRNWLSSTTGAVSMAGTARGATDAGGSSSRKEGKGPATVPPVSAAAVGGPLVSAPRVSAQTVTEPPATTAPESAPQVSESPVNSRTVSAQTVSEPPAITAPVSAPQVNEPPVSKPPLNQRTAQTVSVPPAIAAPVSSPPVSAPLVNTHPVSAPPVSLPQGNPPRVSASPVSAPPISLPQGNPPRVSVSPLSAPPVAGDRTLVVAEHGIGTGVEGHELVGRADSFTEGTSVCFWTRVVNGSPGQRIQHVWLHEGRVRSVIELPIATSSWRTQSRYQLTGGSSGAWTVEARDGAGRTLASASFRVEGR